MNIQAETKINSTTEKVWEVVSDIKNAAKVFKDIKSIEILEKPHQNLLGLKWKETREFMGKEAEETMWIAEVKESASYTTEAINCGCLYHTSVHIKSTNGGVIVTKSFTATPQSFIAKMMSPFMRLMKRTLEKCLKKDLSDLKSFLEE